MCLGRHGDAELSDVHLLRITIDAGAQHHRLIVIRGRGVHQEVAQADVVAVLGNTSLQLMECYPCVLLFHRRLRYAYAQLFLIGEERIELQLHIAQRKGMLVLSIVAHAELALMPVDGTEGKANKAQV